MKKVTDIYCWLEEYPEEGREGPLSVTAPEGFMFPLFATNNSNALEKMNDLARTIANDSDKRIRLGRFELVEVVEAYPAH